MTEEKVEVKIKKHSNKFSRFFKGESDAGNLFFTTMNVINCIFGSGIIALPFASQKSGLGLSLLMMPLAGIVSAYTCMLVVIVCNRTDSRSYSEAVERVLGRWLKYVVLFSNLFFPAFISIAYGVAIFENSANFFKYINFSLGQNKIFILVVSLGFIVFPISLFNDLRFLVKISTLSVVFIIFYVTVFVININSVSSRILILPSFFKFANSGFVQSLGTFFFSFAIHHNIVSLFYSTKKRSECEFMLNMGISTFVAIIIYIICIFAGFLSFPGVAKSNLFENYCDNNALILTARFVFTITILATYPFQLIAARKTLQEAISVLRSIKPLFRYVFTFCLLFLFGICSYFANSFGTVLEIGGCLTASPLVLIIPPLLYMKFVHKSFKIDSIHKAIMFIILIFGIVLMVLGTTFAIQDVIKDAEVHIPMYWC